MKTFEKVQSGSHPEHIRVLLNKVLIASGIKEIASNDENSTLYEYTLTEYTKDEYIGILDSQLNDTQLALVELYEEMMVI